ncbi:MAG: DUF3617 family protein [Steroidobacteraceae bacterium]|nr:DUF3617 family protein [Nevskiaceae bacterium]MCP5339887.1 DUF3617 family protein [Nevskiaceae bacterium]MCP5360822.1 DUF3617 family protein [Nevskiaceae bacterium]MCP5466906.1 DUF3617 family protein [Nevskiaceae bacterium]MCP5470995.1 DUF3617 family protein [Nevskiaceae bacterium]
MHLSLRTPALTALLAITLGQVVTAQAPTPGERWRTTMSIEAMGMKMPGMTNEVCTPKGQENQPPPMANDDCQISNMRQQGNKTSFDMQCKSGMSGRMEMTQESPTKWSGRMQARTSDGEMTVAMSSEKLPGECDANAQLRKFNKAMADGAAQQAQACMASAREVNWRMFVGPAAVTCKDDKAAINAFCSQAKSMNGYNLLAREQRRAARLPANSGTERELMRTALIDTGKLCGFAPETVRTQHCANAQSQKAWTFFAEDCPELARPIAQRECAGRGFTVPVAPAWKDFCAAYAAGGGSLRAAAATAESDSGAATSSATRSATGTSAGTVDAGANDTADNTADDGTAEGSQKATDKAKDAMKKGKDALKGLFGR